MTSTRFSRRQAITGFASWLAASPLVRGQQGATAPVDELVNTLEFATVAERQIGGATFQQIAGSDRRPFDRITLRPRMMVNTMNLDMTTELFGEKLYAPILLGPIADQLRYHPEGEVATARGASAAKTVMVVSSRSSCPLEKIVAQAKGTFWYQVYPEADINRVRGQIEKAVALGCRVVCVTVGAPSQPAADWKALDQLRQGVRVPVLLKGVMNTDEARTAVEHGFAGIIVSDHGWPAEGGFAAPIEALPAVVEAVGGKAPVLVDSGFRRGTDVLKGLALGARAVLLGRPPMWGLAAYGSDGVQTLLKLMQTELARDMAMCGTITVRDISRKLVTIHRR
jgi:4-hydroxymandelate oxidase